MFLESAPTLETFWSEQGRSLEFLRAKFKRDKTYDNQTREIVMFCNTLEIILTNPNHPQHYGTQYNDLDSQSASRPTPTKHRTHVSNPSSTSKSSCHPSDSQDDLLDPRPYPHPAPWASVPISASAIKPQPRSPSQPPLGSPYSNSPTLLFPFLTLS